MSELQVKSATAVFRVTLECGHEHEWCDTLYSAWTMSRAERHFCDSAMSGAEVFWEMQDDGCPTCFSIACGKFPTEPPK